MVGQHSDQPAFLTGGIFHGPFRIDGSLSFGQYIRNISMNLPEGARTSTRWVSDVRRTLAVAWHGKVTMTLAPFC